MKPIYNREYIESLKSRNKFRFYRDLYYGSPSMGSGFSYRFEYIDSHGDTSLNLNSKAKHEGTVYPGYNIRFFTYSKKEQIESLKGFIKYFKYPSDKELAMYIINCQFGKIRNSPKHLRQFLELLSELKPKEAIFYLYFLS